MTRPTFSELYTYMAEAPRTRGWGAFLIYDRQKANLLLMQEHILRSDSGAWIEPISAELETETGKYSRLENFAFGTPVLSFENSNIGGSMAALSIPVIGGKLTEWSRVPGAELPTLVGISHLDPLTAPRVKMNIKLNDGAGGVVDEDGRVYLDLSQSNSYYFEVSQWKELNTKLGQLIQDRFKDPGRGEQTWELSRLEPMEGNLSPTTFRLRTHSLARAGKAVPSTNQAELEEGAIIVGVAFNGAENGDFPDEDKLMPYLLPSRESGGVYSAGIVMSSYAYAASALTELFYKIRSGYYVPAPVTYVEDSDGFVIGAKGGGFRVEGGYSIISEPRSYYYIDVLFAGGVLSFTAGERGVMGKWEYDGVAGAASFGVRAGEHWSRGSYTFNMRGGAEFALSAKMIEGSVLELAVEGEVKVDAIFYVQTGEKDQYLDEGLEPFIESFKNYVGDVVRSITGKVETIDYWRLNSLLFRNGHRSMPDTFSCPGEVMLLGDLAPALTAFAIDPIELTLSAENTQELTLTPAPPAGQEVTWAVSARPDDPEKPVGPENLGEVVNSVYKAPKAEKIAGTFRQVIITATVGENSSSALFTVVPKPVAVRPQLLNALYSTETSERYVLEGGSVGASLTWTKGDGFKGELRDPTADDRKELNIPDDKIVKVYVAPKKNPEQGPVLGSLMQLDQVHVSAAGRTETIDITVVWSPTAATLKMTKDGTALKLVLAVQGWGGDPTDLPPEKTKWFVAKGKGTLDEAKGTYHPAADEGNSVIIAGVGLDSFAWNYVVVPMPYTFEDALAFEEMSKALQPTQAERVEYTAEQIESMEAVKKAFSSLNVTGA